MSLRSNTIIKKQAFKLLEIFNDTRSNTIKLFERIDPAFTNLQSLAETSPAKWHLAHTTWFFETLVLKRFIKDYQEYDESFNFLFNSYYNSFGAKVPRAQRYLIEKPDIKSIYSYRTYIDEQINQIFENNFRNISAENLKEFFELLELGNNHEQQHQELILTDIKHVSTPPNSNHLF